MTSASADIKAYGPSSTIRSEEAGPSRNGSCSNNPWSPPFEPSPYPVPSAAQPGRLLPSPASHQFPFSRPTEPLSRAIPQPVVKADYAPPVFQTFQERKRAKEMARLSLAEGGSSTISSQSWNSGGDHSAMGTDSHAPQVTHPTLPMSLPSHPARPLPRPINRPSSPLSSPIKASTDTPTNALNHAALDRSDTVSSVRSLDRGVFGSPNKRPLPKPPVAVASSKSLDRGIPGPIPDFRRMSRKQPSTVEESELEVLLPSEAAEATWSSSPADMESPSSDPKAPAKFTPIPAISFPEGTEDQPRASVPDIVFSDVPLIAVSSEEPSERTDHRRIVERISADLVRSPSVIQPSAAILCAGCEQPIIGRIVSAMKRRWHPQCFSCAECGENLEHASCYEWEGKPYCHLDFHDKFAYQCHHCKTPIVDSRFITLNDEVLGQRFYHELHFFCSECGDPFLDPSKSSAPGTENSTAQDEVETNAFVIQKGHPYCEQCHYRLHKPRCKGCRKPIPDVAISAMGAKWHKECFVCNRCGQGFANDLFFPMDGEAFCTECYEGVTR